MSFVIWYKVEISQVASAGLAEVAASVTGLGLPITVSNDVLAGSVVLDAEIKVVMTEGASADTFEITLINLPTRTTDLIRAVRANAPLSVSVHLGYFDEPVTRTGDGGLVLTGRITRVTAGVGQDGLARTTLYGQEEAGYLLRTKLAAISVPDRTLAQDFAGELLRSARVELASGSTLPGELTGFTTRVGSILDALRRLTDRADVALVVRDGKVFTGAAVGAAEDVAPMAFDPDTNIVALDNTDGEDSAADPSPPVRTTMNLTVLGHPRLRVGQVAKVTGLTGIPVGTLRITRAVHHFSSSGGYTVELALISAEAGQRAQLTTGVQGAVNRLRDVTDRARGDNPAVDMGEITGYVAAGRHVATLHYGQNVVSDSPSVADPIDPTVGLHDKPIASPFAFDRTGLMTPVYPKMRALLAHNRGLVNDAVVTGFVWADNPAQRRPANQPGDYWLALPTGLDDDGLPAGPGANDLVDAAGRRVIQATGLHIVVGADALPEVGTRPDPPEDNTITIEHASGTTITVGADGGVTVTTDGKPITMTNGSVSLKLDGAAVAVS